MLGNNRDWGSAWVSRRALGKWQSTTQRGSEPGDLRRNISIPITNYNSYSHMLGTADCAR